MKSLWWWLRGRRADVGPDDTAIGYARDQVPVALALTGVVAVESAAVGLLLRWPFLHVLDALAVLQLVSSAAALVVHPHVVGRDGLLVRDGRRFAVRVPPDAIATVRVEWRSHTGRAHRVDGDELVVAVGNQTDVLVELSRPVRVRRPDGEVTRIRFRADDPRAAVAAIADAAHRFGRSSSTIVQ